MCFGDQPKSTSRHQLAWTACIDGCLPKKWVEKAALTTSGKQPASETRWYRIYPDGELRWCVRREAGPPPNVCEDWDEVHEACGLACVGSLAAGGSAAANARNSLATSASASGSLAAQCWQIEKKAHPEEQKTRSRSVSDGIVNVIMMLRKQVTTDVDAACAVPAEALRKDPMSPPTSPSGTSLRRNFCSVPNFADRSLGLIQQGFETDAFSNVCNLCFEETAEVILLPCRHGGLCQTCLRMSLYSKPVHRGGRSCPFCRSRIKEALLIHRQPGKPVQFASTIKLV